MLNKEMGLQRVSKNSLSMSGIVIHAQYNEHDNAEVQQTINSLEIDSSQRCHTPDHLSQMQEGIVPLS